MDNIVPENLTQCTFGFDALSMQPIEDVVHTISPPLQKQCTICLETKPLFEFGAHHGKRNKRCKVCSIKSSYKATLQKQCITCLEIKSLPEFGTNSSYGKNQSCKVCVKKARYQRSITEPGQTKQCTHCLETKPIASFSPTPHGRYGVKGTCKVCCSASQIERYKTGKAKPRKLNPNSGRINKLRANFNMALTDYEKMFEQQNGVCAICGNPETAIQYRTGKIKNLSVDHCHITGTIRGLLCHHCNVMIGMAQDDPNILRKGANYVEKYSN